MTKVIHIIFFLNLLFINVCFGDDKPNLNVSLMPDSGTIDTKFTIQVTISSPDITGIETPVFKENENFEINLNSSSLQVQIINGVSTKQKNYIFNVAPKTHLVEGDYNAPNGFITYNGQKFRLPTQKIHIESTKTFIGSALKAPSQDGFNFLQLVSNERPYIGEQVSYRVEIIAPANLLKADLEDFQLDGVWRERFGQDEKKHRRAYNLTIHTFSEAWFPVRSGLVNIPSRTLHVEVQQMRRIPSSRGLSGQLLNNLLPLISQFSTEEKTITAPPITFEVKPLPTPPNNIFGHIPVGVLKVTSSVDKKNGKVGEPITLTIQVSGDANLKPLEIGPPVAPINDRELRRYDEKPILKKVINNPEVSFYKTFTITFIPLANGNVNIPRFKITWFDPKDEQYKSETTVEETIAVVGESIVMPKQVIDTPQELNLKVLHNKYAGSSYGINPTYALVTYILSLLFPTLYFLTLKFTGRIRAKNKSPKVRLAKLLVKTKSINTLSNLETFQLLKDASATYLNVDAEVFTSKEIISGLKTSNLKPSGLYEVLLDLEKVIYSNHASITEDQRDKTIELIKAMHDQA